MIRRWWQPFGPFSKTFWQSIQWTLGEQAGKGRSGACPQSAVLLGCAADEIVFTSGGSEVNNLVIKGTFFAFKGQGRRHPHALKEHSPIISCVKK